MNPKQQTKARASLLSEEEMPTMVTEEELQHLKAQRMNQEICQRFVRLSCQKMIGPRGGGGANLRRNLLILHLLQKARKDMRQVPAECRSLLDSELTANMPSPAALRRGTYSPRPASPPKRPLAGRTLISGPQRSVPNRPSQTRATTNEKPPQEIQAKPAKTSLKESGSVCVDQIVPKVDQKVQFQPKVELPSPTNQLQRQTTTALVDKNSDVFRSEEKENRNGCWKKEEEDPEELFLQKVGKSSLVSPPVSPPKPPPTPPTEANLEKRVERCDSNTRSRYTNTMKSPVLIGHRLKFIVTSTGQRDYFGISIQSQQAARIPAGLSDTLSGAIEAAPISRVLDAESDDDEDMLPPYLFQCEDDVENIDKTAESQPDTKPTRHNEESLTTESDFTEGEDDEEAEEESTRSGSQFGDPTTTRSSFKRRMRKRKPPIFRSGYMPIFFVAEKRAAKDTAALSKPQPMDYVGSQIYGQHRASKDHEVPAMFVVL